ncbi:conserved hypothetical protein [Campylobacter upsaliensis RM3195]|nr:conserved hypothetical protein [Campylobacter upsaliensis RM3195]
MQILNRLFKESVVENDRAKVRVFDSESFLNRIKELVGESELFKSKEAREFLELVEGFDKLYKNDAIIAKNLTHATASKLSTSIATSAEGAIKQKVVKGAFDPIFRLLPDGVLFGLFSKQIQGGALRYHLRKALSRSLNYDDFKLKLERELKRTHFNSNTSRLIDEFMDNLDKFNAEKEAKLTQMREAQEAKRAEELKRQEAIKAAQENAYHTQEANLGQDILEVEIIEEIGLNEPMKFLEFQQRKLLTYIKQNTPLRLLEHKKELKTRDILNFLEQSALNGKEKAFLMRHLERDLTKLKETKGSEDIIFTDTKGKEHTLSKEAREQWLKAFNLKSLDEEAIVEIPVDLKERLGKEIKLNKKDFEKLVKNKREKYIPQIKETFKEPEAVFIDENEDLIFAKSFNDKLFFVNVNRDYGEAFKGLSLAPKKNNNLLNKLDKAKEILKLDSKLRDYTAQQAFTGVLSASNKSSSESIAQKTTKQSEKEELERQIPFIEAEIQKYEAKTARLDERIKKTQTRIQPYLDEINALQKQYDELYFTETRGDEANAKKWLKLDEIKAKQEELRKPYNDALFKFIHPYQRLKGKAQTEIQKLKFGLQDRAERLEEIQNEALHRAQKAWLEAFGLKSIEETYTPKFSKEVSEALEKVLNGEQIKLTKGSYEKLLKRDREEFLPLIKETLENADAVVKQADGALIFAKDYRNEKLGKFFASVSRNDKGEWVITSNAPKTLNNLKNKIEEGGELLYSDLPELPIIAKPELTAEALNGEANLSESIAQNPDYLELVKEYGEENAKKIIKQKILSENIAQVLESGEEKFIYKKDGKEYELRIQDAMKEFGSRYDELNLKNDLNKAFLKALDKLKIGYEVLENAPVRIRFLKQNKPEQSKTSANNPALWKIQRDMGVRLKELKAQVKENNERYKNEYKALQKELTNTKDLFKSFEKEFNETKGTILISRAKRRKNDAEGKVETSVFLGNELALRNALDRWETYSGYSKENALEVKERLELLKSYVKRLEKHRKDIRAKREQLEQDYRQKNAPLDREISVIRYYKILRNSKGMSDTELYEPFLENTDGYLSKEAFNEGLPRVREEFQKLFNITPLKEFGTNYAEFYKDGKGAIQKLLAEKQGQVSGAFYKEGLGDIDLVWGDDSFGLKHILDKHGGEFEDIAEKLDKIIQNGEVVKRKGRDEAYNIEYKGFKVGINKGFNKQGGNKWVVTAFNDNIEKTAKTAPANDSTKGASLPLNSKQSIAQNSEKLPFEMQVLAEDKLSGDEVRHLANKIGEKTRTMAYFKDYLLKMDRDFHARAKDIIREYYKIEPFRKELENQWANVKEAYNKGEMSLKEFKFLSKYKDEGDFLNQVAQTLWHHNDELVKNRGYTINGYGQIERGKGGNYYQNLALEYDGALKSLKKWFYYIQKANKQAQRFFNKKELEDFGINFEGFKGKEAVLKLLEEKRGQVKGAFYKEGLGEIDLVWGDDSFGLKHILNKHGGEFENLARELSEAVENGKIVKDDKGRLRLEYENKIVGIKDNWKGKKTAHWVVTAYVKKEKEASLYASTSFTKGETLPLNSKQSIAQKNALSLNDEPLEVEVIEKIGLNEPMKFLEFQQRKLLTYIKQNTPLRLLEHKKELKTRDILNFLEQSALNGKEKAFLMRHLERDLDKIEGKIKEKETKGSEDIIFTDTKGKEHALTKEVQELWLETFNLKSLDEAYTPKHSDEIKEALGGKEIKLQLGSLKKLIAQGREQYIPQIKEVLDSPEAIMRDDRGEYLFIKHLKDDDYFVNVSFDNGEYLVSISNGIKETRNLNNKLEKGGSFIYQSPNFNSISQKLLQTSQYSANKIDEDIIAQKAKIENPQDFKPFNDAMKELYAKYQSLGSYDKIERPVKIKLLQDEIKPEIARHFKGIITKLKQGENKAKMLRVIGENREELSDYLAFNIAVRKDIYIDGYGGGQFDFFDKSIQAFFKLREYKDRSEIWDNDTYRALAALENLRNKNTALHFAFTDLNGKIEGFKAYPRKQDLLFDDLTLGNDFKNAMLLSTKNKQLKEKLIEKLKTYIDEKLYRDFLEYKVKDLESYDPKNSTLEGFVSKKWDEEALKFYKKELEDLRANERAKKLEDKIKEKESVNEKVLKSDLLDKTKPLRKAEKEELTSEVLEQVQKENLKLYLNHTNENLTHFLKLEKPLKITMRGANIKHILNKHGENSTLAKNGQPFVSLEDIKNYDEYINNADKQILKENDKGEKTLLSGKQINGYYIVISSVRLKNGELKLKTMYKENGSLENNEAFKGVKLPSETPSVLQGQSLTTNLDGYPSHAGESIAQNRPKALNLQEIEQALKARISQIKDEILAIERTFEDKAFREKLKEASKVKPILEALKKEWKALEPVIVTWTHTDYSKFKPKKYYNRKPNLSNLWHIEETLDVYKGYARENERQAKQVEREITLLEKYVKLLKDKEAEAKKLETDKKALLTESYIIPVYNKLREAFKNGQHTTEQILEAKNIDIKRDSFIAKGIINEIAQLRQYLEQFFNITPLKEFGTNYAEFYKDGKGAIQKLMAEKGGQVSGAFYKEGLGEIDLVWGDDSFGLRHILERRTQDFINQGFKQNEAQNKTKELLNEIPQILENGKIYSQNKDKIEIITDKYTLAIGTRNEKKFIITELIDRRNKKRMEAMQTVVGDSFTDEPLAKTPLSSNHKQSITKKEQEIKPLGAKGWAKFKIDKEQFDELVKDLELKGENRLKIRAKLDEFIKDRGDLYIYDANYNLNLDPDKLNDVDILRLGIKSYKYLHPKSILEDMKEWKKNNFRHLINAMDEKGYLLRLGKRLYEILIEKRKDLQAIFNKYDKRIDEKAKVNAFLRELRDAFNNKNVGKVGYKREKELKSFINKTYAVDKAMVSDVVVERAKKLAEKAFNKTQSKDYIDNLKKWSEGAKYTLADDGLPYMDKKGFYYNDKGLIGNEDYENSLKGYKNFTEFISDLMEDKSGDNQLKDYFLKHRKHAFNEGSFNEKSENIYYSNPHIGAGLVGGTLNGVEQDEEGNLSFDPAKFAMGFLGGTIGSKAVSSAYNKAKAKYYEKNFNKFIDEVNAKKEQMKPRFTLTQELEKAYRENELKIKQSAAEKLNLKGKIFADYIKLAQKHPEYFANPQEAKELSEFIAQNASVGIKASKKEYELIFAEIKGGKGVFALDLEYKGGKHRIRSVYLMKNMQYKKKLFEAKKLGEPILQF